MITLRRTAAPVIAFLIIGGVLWAADTDAGEADLGVKLVRQFWSDAKAQNAAGIEKMLAQGFQSVLRNGPRDRAQEIKLIKELDMGEYKLSDFKVTRNGSVIVVTYFAAAAETVEGKRIRAQRSPRMSIFIKTDVGWRLIAHANLMPLD